MVKWFCIIRITTFYTALTPPDNSDTRMEVPFSNIDNQIIKAQSSKTVHM